MEEGSKEIIKGRSKEQEKKKEASLGKKAQMKTAHPPLLRGRHLNKKQSREEVGRSGSVLVDNPFDQYYFTRLD